jgi:hypothetical protein
MYLTNLKAVIGYCSNGVVQFLSGSVLRSEELERQIDSWKTTSALKQMPLNFQVSVNENNSRSSADDSKELFTFGYNYDSVPQNPLKLTSNDEEHKRLLSDILDRAGIRDLNTSFLSSDSNHPSSSSLLSSNDIRWLHWLKNDVLWGDTDILMLPDTNFIRRHYWSRRFKRMLSPTGELYHLFQPKGLNIHFKISRLTAFELGNQIDRAKQKERGLKKNKKPDEGATKEKREAERQVRLSIHDNYELLRLLKDGAELLPELSPQSAQDFSKTSDAQTRDKMIRKEIRDYFSGIGAGERYLFLTCDEGSFLAASSEGMPTLFFSYSSKERQVLHYPHEPTDLLIESAMYFGAIGVWKVLGGVHSEIFLFEGYWEGKLPEDWMNDCVRMSRL